MDAALAMIQREGAEHLSMRGLAADLGVTPMALYYYVGNKEELLELATDAVLARVPRPEVRDRDWREGLREAALSGFRLLRKYPGLSAHIINRPPTKQSEELARYGVSLMVRAGFDPGLALSATIVCQTFLFGMIGVQAQLERRQRSGEVSSLPMASGQVDPSGLVELGLTALTHGFGAMLRENVSHKKAAVRSRRPRARTPKRPRKRDL